MAEAPPQLSDPGSQLRSPSQFPSSSSVAQFFAQAEQHEHQNQRTTPAPPGLPTNGLPQHRNLVTSHADVAIAHPGAVVTGGPPGIGFPLPTTSAAMPTGKYVNNRVAYIAKLTPNRNLSGVYITNFVFLS